MKTNYMMIVLLGTLALGMSAFAQTTSKPATTDDMIHAQLNITRDATQKIFAELAHSGSIGVENADFNIKAKKFEALLNDELIKYETSLKEKNFQALNTLNLNIQKLRDVAASKNYTPDEKTALLNHLSLTINVNRLDLISAFENKTNHFILGMGFMPKYVVYEEVQAIPNISGACTPSDLSYSLYLGWSSVGCMQTISETVVAPQILEGCYSQSCIILSKVMFSKFFKTLKDTLYTELEIPLTSDNSILIKPNSRTADVFTMFLNSFKNPDNMNSLPFGISQEELPPAITAKTKTEEQAKIKAKEDARIAAAKAAERIKEINIQERELHLLQVGIILQSVESKLGCEARLPKMVQELKDAEKASAEGTVLAVSTEEFWNQSAIKFQMEKSRNKRVCAQKALTLYLDAQ